MKLVRIIHSMFLLLLLADCRQVAAQASMPDTVCVGTSRIYKVNDATRPSTYTWKIDGLVQTTTRNELAISWTVPGVYQLSVQEHANNGCDGDIRSGTVYVIAPPVPNAGPDATLCFGSTTRLAGSGGAVYHWTPSAYLSNPDSPNPVVSIPRPGTYVYVLDVTTANGCRSVRSDTVRITVQPPIRLFAGRDTILVSNQPLQLNVTDLSGSGLVSYSWSPSFGLNNPFLQNPVATVNRDTRYVVTARTADGCSASDDISIKVFNGPDIFVPTGFTPNGDGLNDLLRPVYAGIRELKYFSVFSRWGERVFSTNNMSAGWDGTYKSQKQDGNVFVWEVKGVDYAGHVIRKKGTAVLIR